MGTGSDTVNLFRGQGGIIRIVKNSSFKIRRERLKVMAAGLEKLWLLANILRPIAPTMACPENPVSHRVYLTKGTHDKPLHLHVVRDLIGSRDR